MALLSLQDISVRFGGPWLLENATLNIERGERVCLLGRNGEGKSSFLKVAAGLQEPDAGEVVRARNLVVSMMPQVVPGEMPGNVLETVRQGMRAGLDAGGRDMQARKVISLMELDPEAECAPLSGGMKRRVAMAARRLNWMAASGSRRGSQSPAGHSAVTLSARPSAAASRAVQPPSELPARCAAGMPWESR